MSRTFGSNYFSQKSKKGIFNQITFFDFEIKGMNKIKILKNNEKTLLKKKETLEKEIKIIVKDLKKLVDVDADALKTTD